jgi:hypothetical protein
VLPYLLALRRQQPKEPSNEQPTWLRDLQTSTTDPNFVHRLQVLSMCCSLTADPAHAGNKQGRLQLLNPFTCTPCHSTHLRNTGTLQAVDHTGLAHIRQPDHAHCDAALPASCVAGVVLQQLQQRLASQAARARSKRLLLCCSAALGPAAPVPAEAVCLLLRRCLKRDCWQLLPVVLEPRLTNLTGHKVCMTGEQQQDAVQYG